MSKTFVISGINGQLGQFLAKHLQNNHLDIQIIGTLRHKSYDNQPYIFDKSKVIFELMDLSDSHSIENLISEYKPDYFVNAAATAQISESWKLPIQQFEINTLAVIHQLESIKKYSPLTRYLNCGSMDELDSDNTKSQNEETRINPKSPYACSKSAARYLVNTYKNAYKLYAIQPWLGNFESELRSEKYVSKKISLSVARINHAINNKLPFLSLELGNIYAVRNFQSCEDVCDAVWKMLNQELYWSDKGDWDYIVSRIKSYVVSNSDSHSIKDMVELSFRATGIEGVWVGSGLEEKFIIPDYLRDICDIKSSILVKVNKDLFRPSDINYINGDASSIKLDLNWKPTLSFEELVSKLVKYEVDNYKNNN